MKPFALLLLMTAIVLRPGPATAQDFGFEVPQDTGDPALPALMRDLTVRLLPTYQERDADRYLATLAELQMVVGDPTAALTSRRSLQDRLREQSAPQSGRAIVYDIYTHARAIEASESVPFPTAYTRAFQERLGSIDDLTAYELEAAFLSPTEPLRENFQRALDQRRGKSSITLEEGIDLVRAWFAFDASRNFQGFVAALLADDLDRRYVVEEVAIPVTDDATVAAALVRPRAATENGMLPALLEFTLDRSSRDAREAAAHGYVSVLALARIAGDAMDRPRAPFESDGNDARAVIEWITRQAWSDGRVGMQGTGYGGYVAWSAAKQLPAALAAIATSDPIAPGIDWPNPNGIFHNAAYRWVHDLLATPADKAANDAARFREIDAEWYRSGRVYRELPTLPGRPSTVFRSWLNHPSYDRFWQKWLPFGAEFAAIDIPALTVTGYYSPHATAAWYFFTQHHQHAAAAEHTLLIGPFDAHSVEHGASAAVHGLGIDVAARIDPNDARYAWFDHVLRAAERPSLLSGAVNYELDGANEWHHEPSLAALEASPRRFYVAASPNGAPHALTAEKSAAPLSLTTSLDLRDRADVDWRPAQDLVLADVQPRGGALFVTEPFEQPVDAAGRLRGELDFTVNQYDVDLVVTLYELRSHGEYVKLFEPYSFRASYARDRVNRRLLLAGVRQQLPFQSDRMIGRRLQAGSRLAMTLEINKRADQQLNYGATHDVSEESIKDVVAPTRIRWHEGTFIEIPTRPASAAQ